MSRTNVREGDLFCVRVSLLVPRSGRANDVATLLDELARLCADQPSCLQSYRVEPDPRTGLTGYVAAWSDEHLADELARGVHMLALLAKLQGLAVSRQEHGLTARAVPAGLLSSSAAIREAERLLAPSGPNERTCEHCGTRIDYPG